MKDSFIIFTESRELINECLDETQKAMLLDALFAYACGEPVNLDSTTKAVFISMRQKIDAANQKYEDKCQTNRENGMKGGRPKKTERIQEETEKTERLFSETEKTLPDHDNDPDIKERSLTRSKEKAAAPRTHFIPPTVEEVAEYVREKNYPVDAERFVNFYSSKNWYVGKNKMVNWHSAIANWAKDRKEQKPPNKPEFNFTQRTTDYDALLNAIGG